MFSYTIGLYGLAFVALVGVGLVWWQLPETRHEALPETAGQDGTGRAPSGLR